MIAMKLTILLNNNTLVHGLRRRLAAYQDKEALHTAMADVTVQLAKRAFNKPDLRPSAWAPKKDGTPATLRKNNVLARSPRRVSATPKHAIVGSDRKYAAIHQLGGETRPMPARPYWGFVGTAGVPSERLKKRVKSALLTVLGRR